MASYRAVQIDGFIDVTVHGLLDLAKSQQLFLDAARDAQLADEHLLLDLRGAESDLSYRDVFQLVQILAAHPDAFTRRIALLDVYGTRFEKAQFFEASAKDYGFQLRAFVDEERAVAWLEAAAKAVG